MVIFSDIIYKIINFDDIPLNNIPYNTYMLDNIIITSSYIRHLFEYTQNINYILVNESVIDLFNINKSIEDNTIINNLINIDNIQYEQLKIYNNINTKVKYLDLPNDCNLSLIIAKIPNMRDTTLFINQLDLSIKSNILNIEIIKIFKKIIFNILNIAYKQFDKNCIIIFGSFGLEDIELINNPLNKLYVELIVQHIFEIIFDYSFFKYYYRIYFIINFINNPILYKIFKDELNKKTLSKLLIIQKQLSLSLIKNQNLPYKIVTLFKKCIQKINYLSCCY